jgi:chromosome segregation ATPase
MCLATLALPAPAAAQGRMTYCCTDDGGKQVCSDMLPQQCYGKAYREINSRGITVRRVDAPLTAEQRAAKDAADKKAKEEELKRMEQDRKNRALLATYSSEQDIDYVRDRAIGDVQKAIKASQDKQAELANRQKQLDAEAEFYKKKAMPQALQAQIRDNQAEMKALQAAIDGRQKDIEALKARYEEEKLRYRELTQKKSTDKGGAAAPTGAASRPR